MDGRINDLPSEARPREKMQISGPASLTNEELLAIFLRTGMKGLSAIEIGRQLLNTHRSLSRLGSLDINTLANQPGMGPAKACQLLAAFELGSRLAKESVTSQALDSPIAIYDFLAPILAHQPKESLHVLVLNSRLHLVTMVEISVGTTNATLAHPRDILRPVLVNNAVSFVLTHNHPSGDPTPSQADRTLTQSVAKAASLFELRFVDHLIVGRAINGASPYYSFSNHGVL